MNIAPPTTDHLSRLYYELEKVGAPSVGTKKNWPYHFEDLESLFALAADFSRWDPRLLQILVEYSAGKWKRLNPQRLREVMHDMQTPQTIGVVAAFIHSIHPRDRESTLFWNYVTADIQPVPPQFFFRDLYALGGHFAERSAKESLAEFKQWGFLGSERIVIHPDTKGTAGTWDAVSRHNILKRLLTKKKRLQISDYLEELQYSISRQQALLDFKAIGAKQKGRGRNAHWIL